MAKIRHFVLMDENGNETGVFTGHRPRQAALKVASRGAGTKSKPIEIRLRERETNKVHIFKGWKELIDAPKNKPEGMSKKIYKPKVKKVEIISPDHPELADAEWERGRGYLERLRVGNADGPGPFR